jgi:hypothetical protein
MAFIKIISLEYSGSTLFDILLGHMIENSVSLGEVERTIEPDSLLQIQRQCSCGNIQCSYWLFPATSYSEYFDHMINAFPDTTLIDSSKTISSMNKLENRPYTLIFLYRECFPWILSCIKRYFRREVFIAQSKNKFKMLPSFIRIEILRRLLLPLPIEWLFRNIRILYKVSKLASCSNISVYAVNYESFMVKFANKSISLQNTHIKRGNKISQSQDKLLIKPVKPSPTFIDYIFNFFLANSGIRTLDDLSDLHSANSSKQ